MEREIELRNRGVTGEDAKDRLTDGTDSSSQVTVNIRKNDAGSGGRGGGKNEAGRGKRMN